ncbi:hypothetical protein [Noviherbaspirillum malthae]|jgi:hypothetical protein|uniref:hypothetical protein n=1 Tax=Noviherbaspirillum malthae TaxID=1260987 RepID=UPI00188E77EC|nr:hypothetical protein [Noviherbaspirillum malthae]
MPLTDAQHDQTDAAIGRLYDFIRSGAVSRQDVVSTMAHLIAAVGQGNFTELNTWLNIKDAKGYQDALLRVPTPFEVKKTITHKGKTVHIVQMDAGSELTLYPIDQNHRRVGGYAYSVTKQMIDEGLLIEGKTPVDYMISRVQYDIENEAYDSYLRAVTGTQGGQQ